MLYEIMTLYILKIQDYSYELNIQLISFYQILNLQILNLFILFYLFKTYEFISKLIEFYLILFKKSIFDSVDFND
jgi:hypothetical protein